MALRGVKVIELAGLAPAPFCGMILSDFGASVIRVDKPGSFADVDALSRGKRSLCLDLRHAKGANVFKKLCSKADVLIEPFRAGVMEKLHLGPVELCKENQRLIYARLTGFGQKGLYSKRAGHDINYIGISGILSALGSAGQKPHHPINLLGDFAGGGLICALGICMALIERFHSGKGQVIDANMVEGSAYIGSWLWTTRKANFSIPLWTSPRGKNILDGGAPFYQTYETKDGKFMAVGALEPQFYIKLLKGLDLDNNEYPQMGNWERTEKVFAEKFISKTQKEWCQIFDSKDACVTPVVPLLDAYLHEHNAQNKSFLNNNNNFIPRPAPRLSRTAVEPSLTEPTSGEHTVEILLESGYTNDEIKKLLDDDIVSTCNLKSSL